MQSGRVAVTAFMGAALGLLPLAGCLQAADEGEGEVQFFVKDLPSDDFDSVFVNFTKVEVHRAGAGAEPTEPSEGAETSPADTTEPSETTESEPAESQDAGATESPDETASAAEEDEGGSWFTIFEGSDSIDLKQFQGDARAFLGEGAVDAGKYTQIRIHVEEVYGFIDGERVEIAMSSGTLKIVRPWSVEAGGVTALTVDFDLDQSIRKTGNDAYRMQPVLRLSVEEGAPAPESTPASETTEASESA